jgi:hypothetical protein
MIGLSGILVIAHIPIRITVLPDSNSIPNPPHLFIIGKTQKSCAMPATRKKIEPYLERPDVKHPAYIEFRIGDYQHELGIIDSKYAPKKRQRNREVRLFTGMSIM